MSLSPFSRTVVALAVVSASALLLSGCASPSTAAPAATDGGAAYPLTIDNCGTELTVEKAPERIVTIKSTTTELLLSLGLGDTIAGTAFLDGPFPANLEKAGAKLPIISDFLPGQEATLALSPDFIYGGWESNFTADGVGERDALGALGIGSYVSPSACKEDGYKPEKLSFDLVFDEIREAGAIFGAPDAAAALIAEQKAELAALTPAKGSPSALWYSSGTDTPYVGAGGGAPEMIMTAAGLNNVFADVDDTWTSVGWEAIIEQNPAVIVLVDASWNTAASKIENLEANPVTSQLDAVKNKSYVILPFAATEAGVRNVEAVSSAIDQLAELGK